MGRCLVDCDGFAASHIAYFKRDAIKQPVNILGMALLLYYLAILLMSLFRAPHHQQCNDSANRLFTQMLPLFVLFLTLLFEQVFTASSSKTTKGELPGIPADRLTPPT